MLSRVIISQGYNKQESLYCFRKLDYLAVYDRTSAGEGVDWASDTILSRTDRNLTTSVARRNVREARLKNTASVHLIYHVQIGVLQVNYDVKNVSC